LEQPVGPGKPDASRCGENIDTVGFETVGHGEEVAVAGADFPAAGFGGRAQVDAVGGSEK
jgi:hypothetical protein